MDIPVPELCPGLEMYFSTSVWIPSLTLAMLHYSMLTWRATFITYLINVGYSLNFITTARTVGSVFEIGSTILTPLGIRYTGKAFNRGAVARGAGSSDDEAAVAFIRREDSEDPDEDDEKTLEAQTIVGLQRFGLWGFSLQLTMLVCTSQGSASNTVSCSWRIIRSPWYTFFGSYRLGKAMNHLPKSLSLPCFPVYYSSRFLLSRA